MLAPGRALICGATLGPITAIPQEKMARRDRESTGRKIRTSTSGCDKARLVTKKRQAANETAAVACGRLLSNAPVVGRTLSLPTPQTADRSAAPAPMQSPSHGPGPDGDRNPAPPPPRLEYRCCHSGR